MYYTMGLGNLALNAKDACEWYKGIGININGSRLQELHDYIFFKLMNTSTEEAKDIEKGIINPDVFSVLSEAHGFGLIASELSAAKHLKSHLPKKTLKDIITGPLFLTEETVESDADARNKFVELELAAFLLSAGISVVGFDDVQFEFEDTHFLVECKRPFSPSGLERNIKKAYTQLHKKLKEPSHRGLIAVAVDKAYSLDSKLHSIEMTNAGQFAIQVAHQFRSDLNRFVMKNFFDHRVVGVIAIIRFLWQRSDGQIGCSYTVGLVKLASQYTAQATDSHRLDRFVQQLQSDRQQFGP
jgi:hypothetical protein